MISLYKPLKHSKYDNVYMYMYIHNTSTVMHMYVYIRIHVYVPRYMCTCIGIRYVV